MRLRHSFGNGDQSSKKYGRRIVLGVGPVENEDKCSEDPRKIFRDDVMRLSLITIENLRAPELIAAAAAFVDTDGRGLALEPHPASIQDRDGGGPLLRLSRRIFPLVQRVFADRGEKVTTATLIAVEIVRKNPDQVGFAVNPRRWVVERFFAWIGRNRRLAKLRGYIDSARAFLYAASVMLLVRRIARPS